MSNKVQSSTDYDQFELLNTNREPSRGHIEAIKRAFENTGNFTEVQPILVNERYQIIDGQHRFVACRELKIPIYFTVQPGLGINEARSMNVLHRGWKADDYARSYANSGDPNYIRYLAMQSDYGISHSVLLTYLLGADVKGMYKHFREGTLVITPDEEAVGRVRLDRLADFRVYTPLAKQKAFAMAVRRAIEMPDYDHAWMLKKLGMHAENMLKPFNTVQDNLRQLEEIYNYKRSDSRRIRLY